MMNTQPTLPNDTQKKQATDSDLLKALFLDDKASLELTMVMMPLVLQINGEKVKATDPETYYSAVSSARAYVKKFRKTADDLEKAIEGKLLEKKETPSVI